MSLKSQTTKVIHKSDCWIEYFSVQPRAMLDGLADAGWINKSGNKYYTVLVDSSVYSNVGWHNLYLDTPLLNNADWWAFRGDEAIEPYLLYCREIEIKFVAGEKQIKITEFPPLSNLDNHDLSTYFNNSKLHKPKKDREKKLREKKEKIK